MTQSKWNAKHVSTMANALIIVAGVPQIHLDASTWDPTTTLDLLQQMSTLASVEPCFAFHLFWVITCG